MIDKVNNIGGTASTLDVRYLYMKHEEIFVLTNKPKSKPSWTIKKEIIMIINTSQDFAPCSPCPPDREHTY